jgi:hypothetical protein
VTDYSQPYVDDIVRQLRPHEVLPHLRRGTVSLVEATSDFVEVVVHGGGTIRAYLSATGTPEVGNECWVFRIGDTWMLWNSDINRWHNVGAAGEPAFLNSWSNFGSGWCDAGFRMTLDCSVEIRGLVDGGANPSAVFQLPTDYRPITHQMFAVQCNSLVVGRLDVQSDGNVIARLGSGGTNAHFSLWCRFTIL